MFSVSLFFDETLPNFPFLLIYSNYLYNQCHHIWSGFGRGFLTRSAWYQFIQRLDLRKRLEEKADVIVYLITKDVRGTESMATDNSS